MDNVPCGMDNVPFKWSVESVLPTDLRRLKRKLNVNEGANEDCFCSRAKRVLTEEAMAAGLQELHLVPPPPAAVVTTTVTVYTPATSSSTAWPAQQAIALSPHGYRAHALSGSCADTACAARESSNDVQQPDSLMCEDAKYNTSEDKGTTWQDLEYEDEDNDNDDTQRSQLWLSPEVAKTLESNKGNGNILPSAVFSQIARHSNMEGRELERVPPISSEVCGMELVPWVKPERIIEQSLLKSIVSKDHSSDEEEDIKVVQKRDSYSQSLSDGDENCDDNDEKMET